MGNHCDSSVQRAYILAGGKSSRFGSPKALVDIGGEALIDRLCRRMSSRGIEPTIVANAARTFPNLNGRVLKTSSRMPARCTESNVLWRIAARNHDLTVGS